MRSRAPQARLVLLDSPSIVIGGRVHSLPQALPSWMLARLGVHADWMSREELAVLLWPDAGEDQAQHRLRVHLHRLRDQLGELGLRERLVAERQRVSIAIDCDVARFRDAVGRGDRAAAVSLHRRPLLSGWRMRGFDLLEEWADVERRQLLTGWIGCARRHAQDLAAAGAIERAEQLLAGVLETDPLAEDVVQDLLQLAAQHPSTLALPRYDAFATRLREELGAEPMKATLALADAVRERRIVCPSPPVAAALPMLPRALIGTAPLVGREREIGVLRASTAPMTLVIGEPGIGKSRLLAAAFPDACWLRCREGLTELPWHPMLGPLREQRKALVERLPSCRQELARLIPEYSNEPPAAIDPQLGKPRLFEALAQALAQVPAPIVVDDLQWADALTLEWLSFAARRGGSRFMVAMRAGEESPGATALVRALAAEGLLQRQPVGPIDDRALGDLLRALSGADTASPRFAAWLGQASGGNPCFALEILRDLFDTGRLRVHPGGGWASDLDRITIDYRELDAPPGVVVLVQARVERLPEPARRVLEALAVAGETSLGDDRLAAICGLSVDAAIDAHAQLEAAGFVAGGRFVHDLVRQSVYRGAASRRRERLHGLIAEALESLPMSRRAEPSTLARHWREAGQPERAWRATFESAQAARERGGLEESARIYAEVAASAADPLLRLRARAAAAEHLLLIDLARERAELERVLEDLERLPRQPGLESLAVRVHAALADNAVYDGELDRAQGHVDRMEPMLPRVDAAERQHALEIVVEVAMRRGDYAAAHTALDRARAEHPGSVTMLIYEAMLAWSEVRLTDAISVYERVVRDHPGHLRYITVENDYAIALHATGDVAQAEFWLRRGLRTWEGVPHAQCLSLANLGAVLTSAGRYDEAAAALRESLELARSSRSRLFEGESLHRLGRLLLLAGDASGARRALDQAISVVAAGGDRLRVGQWHAQAVAAALATGDRDGAASHLATATGLIGGSEHPIARARLARARAQFGLASGRHADADGAADEMIAIARRAGLDELLAEGLLLRVSAHEAGGSSASGSADADEALAIAVRRGLDGLTWRAHAALARHGGTAGAQHAGEARRYRAKIACSAATLDGSGNDGESVEPSACVSALPVN